jgi:outer membrane protein OmpA-like peptidoglycan-associated protein
MRKLLLGLALASTALATPTLAKNDSWYVEVDAGAMIVEKTDVAIAGAANAATLKTDRGYDVGGIVGYDFGGFRLETEVGYRRARADRLTSNTNNATADRASNTLGGRTSALSYMVNGLLDFGSDDGLQAFVGGGVGIANVKYAISTVGLGGANDSDTNFAWQALAGVRAPISDHWDVGVKYRYFNVNKLDLVGNGALTGQSIGGQWRSHSILGTLAYNFGGAEPAPEPAAPPPPPPPPAAPPPPPPPPPPPAPVCNKGPYIVFFDWDKSNITPEAATILDNAVTAYGNCASVPIMLAGYTDRSGSPKYNQGLSERRNTSVRGYLTAHGIPDGAISSQAFGESNPRVPTADGVKELQNRRVEITYGPGSGM